MPTIKRFEDLEIWQSSYELDKELFQVYSLKLLKYDLGFRSQILNSSGSCMDNISEGFERGGNKEFINFLRIAKASIGETRSQVQRSLGRKYIDEATCKSLADKCETLGKRIGGMIRYLEKSDIKGPRYLREVEGLYRTEGSD